MEPIKIIKSEFEKWAKDTPILYASDSGKRFLAYVDGGGYKVTNCNKILYEGGSFSIAASIFNDNMDV